jgi:hypothetical protein
VRAPIFAHGASTDDYWYAMEDWHLDREEARDDAVRLEAQGRYAEADALREEYGLPPVPDAP